MNAHPDFIQYTLFIDRMIFFAMYTRAEPGQDRGTLALAHSSRRLAYNNY